MEVAPGVHKVDGVIGCSVYLLVGDELTLIDSGFPGNHGIILRYIRRLGRKPEELTRILFTHGHPDHTGSANALRRRTGAKVLVHDGDTRRDDDGNTWVHYVSQPFAFSWDVPLFQQVLADEPLEEGMCISVLGGLRVLHTPGHTEGGVSLYLEELGVIFTGDTLLSNGKTFSRPAPLPGYDSSVYQESLERLAKLDFDVICGGHGKPLSGGASRMLRSMMGTSAMDSYWNNLSHRLLVSLGVKKPPAHPHTSD